MDLVDTGPMTGSRVRAWRRAAAGYRCCQEQSAATRSAGYSLARAQSITSSPQDFAYPCWRSSGRPEKGRKQEPETDRA